MDAVYKLASDQIIATTSSTLPKRNYQHTSETNGIGVSLELNTKEKFDADREKRIQLYAHRWEKGCECISGKPMLGSELKEWYEWRKFYKRNNKNQKKISSQRKIIDTEVN